VEHGINVSMLLADGAVTAGNLPVPLTGLVGRAQELAALASLLRATRLLTLVGTGGCGKTRLALALAQASAPQFADGAWWVDLASVSEAAQVADTAAAALGVKQSPGEDTAVTMGRHLRRQSALIVLDNCEQVVEGCAAFIARLLQACRGLRIVATSREVVGVPGENVFRVPGLRLPARGGDGDAVDLFLQRARATRPGLSAGAVEKAAIARVCRQLDGLPLAIELAAARVSVLGVTEIADRLEKDAGLLRHPSRTAPARHRTLRATLDWSHRLLTEPEQVLFRRLSICRGGFPLAAAEAVAAGGVIDGHDIVDLMAGLVAKSLVIVSDRGGEYRYRMLETIRQYGERKLADSGEQPAVAAAHARFYLALAQDAQAGLDGTGQPEWLDRLECEHDNLRAVLARSVAAEPELAARLAGLLWPFWYRRGYYHEARSWLEQAVAAAATRPVSGEVLAAALTGAGVLAFLQCDYPVAAARLGKARARYEEAGDRVGLATTLQRLGSIAREEGRYADSRRLHEESLALWEELADEAGVAASRDYLGFVAWLVGDANRAAKLCRQALATFEASGRRQETAAALINLGMAAYLGGDAGQAVSHLRASLDIARQLGYQEGIAWALHELAVVTAGDDLPGSAAMLRESLAVHLRLGDRWRVASVVESIAALAAPADPAGAATLLGGASALRTTLGAPVPPAERAALDRCGQRLRATLGEAFAAAYRQGRALPLDQLADAASQAIAAVAADDGPAGDAAKQVAEFGLTGREVAVLRLLAGGLTNREIGRELAISAGTAGVHVSNVLRKLGVGSRVQAATIAQRLGI